jgi:hypothetical protein
MRPQRNSVGAVQQFRSQAFFVTRPSRTTKEVDATRKRATPWERAAKGLQDSCSLFVMAATAVTNFPTGTG